MVITDASGLPVALDITSASPHEVTLVERTLATTFVPASPERLIGDGAYDSNKLDETLALQGIDMIAPHKSNCVNKTQDGRKLRRYKRRWKVERFFAWLYNFRHLVVRYDHKPQNYLAFVQLACIFILLRHF